MDEMTPASEGVNSPGSAPGVERVLSGGATRNLRGGFHSRASAHARSRLPVVTRRPSNSSVKALNSWAVKAGFQSAVSLGSSWNVPGAEDRPASSGREKGPRRRREGVS